MVCGENRQRLGGQPASCKWLVACWSAAATLWVVGCGGGGGGSTPTSPNPPATYLVATNSILSFDVQGTYTKDFDTRMDFDGRTVERCQPTTLGQGHCGYLVTIPGVQPGQHRITIVVTRQARSTSDYRYYGSLTVMNEVSGARVREQEFNIRGRLRVGESLSLEVPVP